VASGGIQAVQCAPSSLNRMRDTCAPEPSAHVRPSVTDGVVVVNAPLLMTMVPVGGVVSSRM